MNSALTCRLLAVEDYTTFREVRLRACREEPAAFLEAYEELVNLPAEHFKRHFENGWIAGAFMGTALVGIAGLFRHKGAKVQHKGTVWGVYVAPEARGHGMARCMIEMVIAEAKQAGVELLHITTDEQNPLTIALYKSLGFEPWGIEKHILKLDDGSYINDVVMVKWLV